MSLALINRAKALEEARLFFKERGILEVDVPALIHHAPLDSNVDVIQTDMGYLHTSPEYALKRLLVQGMKDIYFLGHVYRKGEVGRLHNPEFTMAEWYRVGISFEEMIQETCEFLFLFLGKLPIRFLSYRDAFSSYANLNYTKDPLPSPDPSWNRNDRLHYIMSHSIEPHLGQNELTVLRDFPPDQAALASLIEKDGEKVAERFEIYHKGVELTNGYHELSDADELRKRFNEENEARVTLGKTPYTLDEAFLSALKKGLPDCCGVSVGFDRALMLKERAESIGKILPFPWK